jgi:hypothetical protein
VDIFRHDKPSIVDIVGAIERSASRIKQLQLAQCDSETTVND